MRRANVDGDSRPSAAETVHTVPIQVHMLRFWVLQFQTEGAVALTLNDVPELAVTACASHAQTYVCHP